MPQSLDTDGLDKQNPHILLLARDILCHEHAPAGYSLPHGAIGVGI